MLKTAQKQQMAMKKEIRKKSPEERMDDALLTENWRLVLVVILFLKAGIGGFMGLMPEMVAAGVAVIFASLESTLIAVPLFWESDGQGRMRRRIHRAAYFPIRRKEFLLSKWRRISSMGGICFLVFLVAQLITVPLFGVGNILLVQTTFAFAFAVTMLLYTAAGMLG